MRYDVSSGQISSGITLYDDFMYVYNGGVANETTVNDGGYLAVFSGGTANSTTINGEGWADVHFGGIVSGAAVCGEDAELYVFSGGTAYDVAISSAGQLKVKSGGTALNVSWTPCVGEIDILPGAVVTFASSYRGVYYGSDNRLLSSAMTMTDKTVSGNYAVMWVCSGGLASDIKVYDPEDCEYGYVVAVNGGRTEKVTVFFDADLVVDVGGIAGSSIISSGGGLTVNAGGIASNTEIKDLGALLVAGRGKVTGKLTVTKESVVLFQSGGILDFDISRSDPGSTAPVNDISVINVIPAGYEEYIYDMVDDDFLDVGLDTPDYTVTVSARQTAGTYNLAGGAADFDSTITVNTVAGTTLGVLSVGGSFTYGAYTYSLDRNDSNLTLTVAGGAPVAGVTPGDLNGDGRADIVMTIAQEGHGADGSTGAWLIQADQTAAWGDLSQRNAGWEIFGTGFTAAGKETNDVYVKSEGNVVGAWTTDATGKVAGWTTVGTFDATTQVLGLGDFNGDGQTDLLLRNTNGAVGCYFTSGEKTGWNYFQSLGEEWTVAAVGDLNCDGRDDVVLRHEAGFAGSWLTQADYTMAWADLDTLIDGSIVGCGDFNGDGTDDVLIQKGNYYGAWIVKDGNVKSWMGLGDLGSVSVEQIADFDADGIDDLRVRTSAGDLGAQLVKGADTLIWKYYGSVGSEWSTALAAI